MIYKIFLIDDHPVMRRGYAALIDSESDLEICGEASSGSEAIDKFEEAAPDLAIVDISLNGFNGIELIKHLKSRFPDVLFLVISMHDESLYAERALGAGAMGYLMKSEAEHSVVSAIRNVLQGHIYLSEAMKDHILMHAVVGRGGEGVSSMERLSDRELEVFESIGRGFSTAEIAVQLVISIKTVEAHRQRIKSKLGIESSVEMVRRAVHWISTQ